MGIYYNIKQSEIIKDVWIVIIFLQGLIQALFSGAIADSIVLWSGIGLLFSIGSYDSKNQKLMKIKIV